MNCHILTFFYFAIASVLITAMAQQPHQTLSAVGKELADVCGEKS